MTRQSFSEYIETAAPETITASHYDLAPDAYGLDDGYAWAWSETPEGEPARRHLSEGGEWPYYIAAKPNTSASITHGDRYTAAGAAATRPEIAEAVKAGRVLETYCEGDLTAYVFETRDERDAAARAWEETDAEYVARVLVEDHNETEGEEAAKLGAAMLAAIRDHEGANEPIERDTIATWTERLVYRGSAAEYWAEWVEEMDAVLVAEVRHGYGFEAERTADAIERRLTEARMAQDWDDYARDRDADTETTERDGFVFDAGR